MNDHTARHIYQAHLDNVGAAITTRDFDLYQTFFTFPHRFETMTDGVHISTPMDLAGFFDTLCAQLDRHEVPNMDRLCKQASFSDARTIKGYHQTRLVRPDAIVVDSFDALCTLELHGAEPQIHKDKRWLLSHSQFLENTGALPSTVLARYLKRHPKPDVT
jgi:hypothetical protein